MGALNKIGRSSMNNLCFLSNLTSSEWAAWVQAIGSIAALVVAIGITNRAEMTKRKEISIAAGTFGSQLIASLATLRDFAKQDRRQDFNRAASVLNEVYILGHTIQIELLTGEKPTIFFKLRAIGAEAKELINEVSAFSPNTPITSFEHQFQELRGRASQAAISLHTFASK